MLLNNQLQSIITNNPTSFFKFSEFDFISEKYPEFSKPRGIYHFINNLTEIPKCECGKNLKFISFNEGYGLCEDRKCKYRQEIAKQKRKETNLKKFGVENPFQSEETKEKIKQTCIEKYGTEYSLQSKDVREKIEQTKLDKYGNKHYNNQQQTKQTCIEKYGVESPLQSEEIKKKIKQTCIEKYGVENPNSSIEIKKKKQETCIEKYGAKTNLQSEETKEKIKQTCIEKYGTEYSLQSKDVREKIEQTNLNKFGVRFASQSLEIKDKIKSTNWFGYFNSIKDTLPFIADSNKILEDGDLVTYKKCNHITNFIHRQSFRESICPICFPLKAKYSVGEKEVLEFIKNHYSGEVLENAKGIIGRKELDIFIPALNLAFEFNGVYWHSSHSKEDELVKEEKHLLKTELSENKGINLFHILDIDWISKREIIESMIKQKLGLSNKIPARKCEIRQVNLLDSQKFLNSNHLQGMNVASVRLGLYYQDELVSLMTFSKPRFNKKYDWELIRFCNKVGFSVQGGASKLFKYFRDNFNGSIISYANRSHSNGNLYKKLGMELVNVTSPNYFWTNGTNIFSRYQTQKHKLKDLLGETFNPNLTESENMYNSGYSKYFDSGNLVYTKS